MNYTEVYRKIYDSLKCDGALHEDIHRSALKITDAIADLFSMTKHEGNEVFTAVSGIANQLWNPLNLGGFDLDDSGKKII